MSAFSTIMRANNRVYRNSNLLRTSPVSSQFQSFATASTPQTVEAPRKAATTIVMAKDKMWADHSNPPAGESFQILMVKRSPKSRFMPSLHVFPGGVVEEADKAPQWLALHEKARLINDSTNLVTIPILNDHVQDEKLSDRICAQRELFEETGLLIGASVNGSKAFPIVADTLISQIMERMSKVGKKPEEELPHFVYVSKLARDKGISVHEMLRQEVLKDPLSFLSRTLGLLGIGPAAPSLFPFARWITPTFERKRYDTNFYLIGMDSYSDTVASALRSIKIRDVPRGVGVKEWLEEEKLRREKEEEEEEVTGPVWLSPREALRRASKGEINLAPPTFYVLSQLASFHSMEEALNYVPAAVEDNNKPLRPWLTQRVIEGMPSTTRKGEKDGNAYSLPQGSFIALPGDHAHALATHVRPTDNGVLYKQFLPFLPLAGDIITITKVRDEKAIHRVVIPTTEKGSYEIQISDPLGTRQFQTYTAEQMAEFEKHNIKI